MKTTFLSSSLICCLLAGATSVTADEFSRIQEQPDASAATVTDQVTDGQNSATALEAPPLDPMPIKVDSDLVKEADAKYGKGKSKGGCGSGALGWLSCQTGQPWTLPQPGVLQGCGIRVGGWIEQGITFNSENPADGFNGPVATNDLDSEYQMNQLWLYLDRQVDNGGCGWGWGGHIDMLYGTDFRFGENNGLEERINGQNFQRYGMVIPQAYLEIGYNDLSVKLGHFAAILDYEVIPAPMNPFYSHSYSYGYTVPQLVTGILADWKITDQLSVQGGTHRGWMQWEDINTSWDVMAGVKWNSSQGGTSLAYAISTGPQSVPMDDQNRFVHSLVLQQKLTDRLKYVMVQNYGLENYTAPPAGPIGPQDTAEWYGLNQYLLYQLNPCWAANLRVEWMRDDDGVRIGGPGNMPGFRAWDGAGYAGNFYNVTAGLNWRPRPNWLIRPELRWDWYDGADSWIPGKPLLPFDAGSSDSQGTFAVDAIFTY